MSELTRFADELAQIRDRIDRVRFRSSDRYVEEMDALRRELTDLVERMRAAASRGQPEDPRLAAERLFKTPSSSPARPRRRSQRTVTVGGRGVRVEQRRRSAG